MGYSQRASSSLGASVRPPEGMAVTSTRRVQDGTAPRPSAASLRRMGTQSIEEVLLGRHVSSWHAVNSHVGGHGGAALRGMGMGGEVGPPIEGGPTEGHHGRGGGTYSADGFGGMSSAHGSFYSEDFDFDVRSIPSVPGSASQRYTYGGFRWRGNGPGPGPSSASTLEGGGRHSHTPSHGAVGGGEAVVAAYLATQHRAAEHGGGGSNPGGGDALRRRRTRRMTQVGVDRGERLALLSELDAAAAAMKARCDHIAAVTRRTAELAE